MNLSRDYLFGVLVVAMGVVSDMHYNGSVVGVAVAVAVDLGVQALLHVYDNSARLGVVINAT